jgi:rod shape-determining protein MreC
MLDLRFVAPNADIQVGDVLITSGLDGVYPAGLAVAKVVQVESAAGQFGRVTCQPLAGIDRHRQLLVLMEQPPAAAIRPAEEEAKPAPAAPGAKAAKGPLPKMAPIAAPPPSTVPNAAKVTPLLPPSAQPPAPAAAQAPAPAPAAPATAPVKGQGQ